MGTISSNKEKNVNKNNFGPASMTWIAKENETEIQFGIMMAGEQVEEYPLNITDAVSCSCLRDEEMSCVINEYGEIIRNVEPKKMEAVAKARKEQGREIKTSEQSVKEYIEQAKRDASKKGRADEVR